MNRHREHTEAAWRKYGRKLWKFGGSYGLGIALMLILLVLTFAGTPVSYTHLTLPTKLEV